MIGPDVNVASRMAKLNKILGEPLLMSRAFADHLGRDAEILGAHALDGFDEPLTLFKPPAGLL